MKGRIWGSWFGLLGKLVMSGILLMSMSGCAAVGPLLTLGGTWITPLQYASTAYTVGEFTYEYAQNGKTPDKVIEAKLYSIADVFDQDDGAGVVPVNQEGPAPVVTADAESERMDSYLGSSRTMTRKQRIRRRIKVRRLQMERLEMRRMAFLQARENTLSLRGGRVRALDLSTGAEGDVSLGN